MANERLRTVLLCRRPRLCSRHAGDFVDQPQFRRAPGPRSAHASGKPRDGGCKRARRSHRGCRMTAFPALTRVTGRAAPLIRPNVDTDAIIPSREIKGVAKTGLSDGLFAGWRYI